MPKFVFLLTDLALLFMLVGLAFYTYRVFHSPTLKRTWAYVMKDPAAMSAGVVLLCFFSLAVLDSVHFRPLLPTAPGASVDAKAA